MSEEKVVIKIGYEHNEYFDLGDEDLYHLDFNLLEEEIENITPCKEESIDGCPKIRINELDKIFSIESI